MEKPPGPFGLGGSRVRVAGSYLLRPLRFMVRIVYDARVFVNSYAESFRLFRA